MACTLPATVLALGADRFAVLTRVEASKEIIEIGLEIFRQGFFDECDLVAIIRGLEELTSLRALRLGPPLKGVDFASLASLEAVGFESWTQAHAKTLFEPGRAFTGARRAGQPRTAGRMPYGYAGERYDADMGLIHPRARWLEPSVGRFGSADEMDGQPKWPISLDAALGATRGGLAVKVEMEAVGFVEAVRLHAEDDFWGGEEACITLVEGFIPESLQGLSEFSHVEVLFLFHEVELSKVVRGARHPRNNPDWPEVGIFAQRGKNRPNRIGSTICRVVRMEGRKLFVAELDAINGTPVLDIKPVMAEFLPRGAVRQPAWSHELMREYWFRKE